MKKGNYLTLGGLFVALHIVFILLARFLPGSSLLLVIFLPLLSTIYTLKFNKKEVAMFIVATLFLCLIFEPVSALIYILPALICGVGYGILKKKNVKELSIIYITSLLHSISLLITFLFIGLLFKETDFFSVFSMFIKKEGPPFYVCVYYVLMTLGVIEAFIVHFICDNELVKLGYKKVEEENETPNWIIVLFFISVIVFTVLLIINKYYSLYCIPFAIAFLIPMVIEFIVLNTRKWMYFIVCIMLLSCTFLLNVIDAMFYPMLLLIVFSPMVVEKIVRVLYTFGLKYSNKKENIIE